MFPMGGYLHSTSPPGIASTVRFGTLEAGATNTPPGIAPTAAFGTPHVGLKASPAGAVSSPYPLTNIMRNGDLTGSVNGTPGTLPTHGALGVSGLSHSIIGSGIEGDYAYCDVRFFGTTTGSGGFYLEPDAWTNCPAVQGQTFTYQIRARQVGGSWANVTGCQINMYEGNATPTQVAVGTYAMSLPTADPLAVPRNLFTATRTMANAGCVYLLGRLIFTAGTAAMMSQQPNAMPYVPTQTGAVTVNQVLFGIIRDRQAIHPATLGQNTALGAVRQPSQKVYVEGFSDSRWNTVRNAEASGIVPGTPGTLPTNWSVTLAGGQSVQVIGSYQVTAADGRVVNVLRVRFWGTVTSPVTCVLYIENAASPLLWPVARPNDSYAISFYGAVSAGSAANFGNPQISNAFYDRLGAVFTQPVWNVGALSATLTRYSIVRTAPASGGTPPYYRRAFGITFNATSGQAHDVTLDIGAPQFEPGQTSVGPYQPTTVGPAGPLGPAMGVPFIHAGDFAHPAGIASTVAFGTLPLVRQAAHPFGVASGLRYGRIKTRNTSGFPTNLPSPQGTQLTAAPRLIGTKYGDGYQQENADGVGHVERSHTFSWDPIDRGDAQAIVDFLDSHVGVPFALTFPRELLPRQVVWIGRQRSSPYPTQDALSVTVEERLVY
jgi:phage-related protein